MAFNKTESDSVTLRSGTFWHWGMKMEDAPWCSEYPCELRWSLLTFHVYDFDSMSESGSPSGALNQSI